MKKVGPEEEEEEGRAGDGRRPESNPGVVVGRWEMQECKWREVEVDRWEEDGREIVVEQEGRKVECETGRSGCFELQKVRTGRRGRRTPQAEGKISEDL